MALAVCLLFDSRSSRLIRQLWDRLEAAGIGTMAGHTHGQHQPHLSYAVLRTWDLDQVRTALDELPEEGPVTLPCQGTLLFPRGRMALAPAVPATVVTRQERVVSAIATTGADLHKHYQRGRWVPHISIGTRVSAGQLAYAVTALHDVLPLVVRAERCALVDSGTGEVWALPGLL